MFMQNSVKMILSNHFTTNREFLPSSSYDFYTESKLSFIKQKPFPEKLKHIRELNGESQTDLAIILSVSRQTIGSYEAGRTEPPFDILRKISKHYRLSLDFLIMD